MNRSTIHEHCPTHVKTFGRVTVRVDDAGRAGSEDSGEKGRNCEDVEEDGEHLVVEGRGGWRDNQEQDPHVRNDSKTGKERIFNHPSF